MRREYREIAQKNEEKGNKKPSNVCYLQDIYSQWTLKLQVSNKSRFVSISQLTEISQSRDGQNCYFSVAMIAVVAICKYLLTIAFKIAVLKKHII